MKGNFGLGKGGTTWISLFFMEWHSFKCKRISSRPMISFGRQECLSYMTKF